MYEKEGERYISLSCSHKKMSHHPSYRHNKFDNIYQTIIKVNHDRETVSRIYQKYETNSSLHPNSPVKPSTWERLNYMCLLQF